MLPPSGRNARLTVPVLVVTAVTCANASITSAPSIGCPDCESNTPRMRKRYAGSGVGLCAAVMEAASSITAAHATRVTVFGLPGHSYCTARGMTPSTREGLHNRTDARERPGMSMGRACRAACNGMVVAAAALSLACGRDSAAPGADTGGTLRGNCANRDASLTLPSGFCAVVFADKIGAARHVVVAPNGDVFVTIQGGGPVMALRDVNNDGRADSVVRIGSGSGGTGIGLVGGFLYVDQGSQIVRYPLAEGALRPSSTGQAVVTGLPTGGHDARNFVIDGQGNLFVNVG